MKRFIALAMISPALLFGQNATRTDTDIRVISGRSVDLAPLHQWYQNPDGAERPLKHWLRLTLLDIKPSFAGSYLTCLVEVENARREVLLKTLPTTIKGTVMRIQSLDTNLITLQQEIEAQEPEVRRNEAQHEGSVVRSTRVDYTQFVTQRYEYERPSRRAVNARLDRVALTERQELATKLYEELNGLLQNTNSYTVFAMDTRRKFGGLPIWETGLTNAAAVQTAR
jgi:hypothetical protein